MGFAIWIYDYFDFVFFYRHQIGFFRDLQMNPQENARPPPPPRANRVNNRDNNPDNQQPNQAPRETIDNNVTNNVNDNQQSLLAVTWMIFTSFFASLIPDTN